MLPKNKKTLLLLLCAGLASVLLCGCAAAGNRAHGIGAVPTQPPAPTAQPAATAEPTRNAATATDPITQAIENMTLRQKIGQLFIIRPDSLDFTQTQKQIDDADAAGVTEWIETLQANLQQYPVGGIALFGKNITDPAQLTALTAALQAGSQTPLLIGVDEEGGAVSRIANHPNFTTPQYESAAAVGATNDPAQARTMGQTIGSYLAPLGFNLDFAPDADVNTNPANPIIGDRAFSADPATAAQMVGAAVQGFHDAGLICCIKHFPGHGDTAQDSHKGLATTDRTWAELQACELLPFAAGIEAGADMVMAAHITTPNATADGLPASLSKTMLTDRLRGELGFTGVIITDSLAMQAITDQYTPVQACRLALDAGADILLMPTDFATTFDALVTAAETGDLPEDRLNESVYRILALKQKYGLL